MKTIETNIYPIENLEELECDYWIYKVKGVPTNSEDYIKNIQLLEDRLSRKSRSPCSIIEMNGEVVIAQQTGFQELPKTMEVVGSVALIEKQPQSLNLNFSNLTSENRKLAHRFLRFALQSPLIRNPSLFQPSAGRPFFNKNPDTNSGGVHNEIDLLRGFTFRIVDTPDGGLGVCLDTKSMFISSKPLPSKISPNQFKQMKGIRCIYEYGTSWYEVKLEALNDVDVTNCILSDSTTLFENVHSRAGENKSLLLRQLPSDCSVLVYYNSNMQSRNVPSALCRQIFHTSHPLIRKVHNKTILEPHIRRKTIRFLLDSYFIKSKFGKSELRISRNPVPSQTTAFTIPDLEFGHNTILSVTGTPGSVRTTLSNFPFKKQELYRDAEIGPYSIRNFDQQYLVLPNSVRDSYGSEYRLDLCDEIEVLSGESLRNSYDPIVIGYDDTVEHSVYRLGQEILKAIDSNVQSSGYMLIMIPRIKSSVTNAEDELANLLMRELREKDLYASIVHTTIPNSSYQFDSEERKWYVKEGKIRRYRGYIRNVVLNKILITNNMWPFILSSHLKADITIGIDVKNNTAGFTLVYNSGENIRFVMDESTRKEELGCKQVSEIISRILREDYSINPKQINSIVIHRQGRFFQPELDGLHESIKILKDEKIIAEDYSYAFVETKTTSVVPLRLFFVDRRESDHSEWINNPVVGTHYFLNADTAFVCNTGFPYRFRGT
ncbi:MAG: hypothetical protein ACTSRU_16845, partial [Candidatus Hodarchaeales archaeon]